MIASLQNENNACIILSGGLSTRMKYHKALLRYSDNQNFLQHIIEVYLDAGVQKIIVIKNNSINFSSKNADTKRVSIINNTFPELGRIYSLQLGLNEISSVDYCFIQNIDNPFVTAGLIEELYNARSYAAYVTPMYNNIGGHPIVISSAIIKCLKQLDDYQTTLRDTLEPFTRHRLATADENCILNINLPSDYQKLHLIQDKNPIA
jgi:CTP:molybdopterin cytidylyltransferase MocA